MRTVLWSRARPKLPSRSPNRAPIARQTASAPAKRWISLNDVFTLLLTPVLATALLADTSWKDKRRKDWAAKIALIEAETEEIQSRALQSWESLQTRSVRLGAVHQRRQFSTAVSSPVKSLSRPPIEDIEYEPEWFEATTKNKDDTPARSQAEGEDSPSKYGQQAWGNSQRVRRLLAIKLALNLTIYINTGVSASKIRREIRIPDWNDDFKYDLDVYQHLDTVMKRMRSLCSSLEHLKVALPDGPVPVKYEDMTEHSQILQDEICDISEQYRVKSLTLPEFVTSYTLAILRSTVAPTSRAYLSLFRGLASGSSLDQPCHDLAMQTLFTWEQSKLPIHEHDLHVILTELARRKHVQKFDGLMRDLTMSPSPINSIGKWTWERANDVQVPVPVSHNPAILMTLIHCGLRFDQPHKAEAWSEILRKTWMNVNDPAQRVPIQQLFTNWMRYYEVQGNWRKGVGWLDAAQKWAISIASFDLYSLQRLAVGMLSLCFACGKTEEYEEILSAAVESGIPPINPRHYLERSAKRAISKEWALLHNEAYRTTADSRTNQEKVQAFQRKVSLVAQRLVPDKDNADVEWRCKQIDKPNPLMPDPATRQSDSTSTEAAELWKQLYSKNQQAMQNVMATADTWKERYHTQQRQVLFLQAQLRKRRGGSQRLAALRTQTPPPDSIENDETDFVEADDILASQSDSVGKVRMNWVTGKNYVVSGTRPRPFGSNKAKSEDTTGFLVSRLVAPEKVKAKGTELDNAKDDLLSSRAVDPEEGEKSVAVADHVHEDFPESHFVRLEPEKAETVLQKCESISTLDTGNHTQQENDFLAPITEDNRAPESRHESVEWSAVPIRRVGFMPSPI